MDRVPPIPPVLPPPPPPAPIAPPLPVAYPVSAPAVLRWYRVYLGAMAAIYLACVVGGILLLSFHEEIADWPPKDEPWTILVYGVVLLVIGTILLAAYLAAFFLPRKPWAWIAHLVLIAIGLTSCCTIPASVPLLVAWLKPDLRAWFGRPPA